jgi:coproporphyrinogen III oxidase-like Fe-S oxidoreductase
VDIIGIKQQTLDSMKTKLSIQYQLEIDLIAIYQLPTVGLL